MNKKHCFVYKIILMILRKTHFLFLKIYFNALSIQTLNKISITNGKKVVIAK